MNQSPILRILMATLAFFTMSCVVNVTSAQASITTQLQHCSHLFLEASVSRPKRELISIERTFPLRSIKMLSSYRQYDRENTRDFSPEEMAKVEVFFRDGRFYHSDGAVQDYGYPQNFVIDDALRFFSFSSSRSSNAFQKTTKHSSVTLGGRLRFGGEAVFEMGKLVYLNNKSGHYAPSAADFVATLLYLNAMGVDLSETRVELYRVRTALNPGKTMLAHDFIRSYIPGWEP